MLGKFIWFENRLTKIHSTFCVAWGNLTSLSIEYENLKSSSMGWLNLYGITIKYLMGLSIRKNIYWVCVSSEKTFIRFDNRLEKSIEF